MTKRQRVAEHLQAFGYYAYPEDIRVVRGPKRKRDCLECWHCYCLDAKGKVVEIGSCYTLTQLCNGLALEPGNTREAQIYGDFLAVPQVNQ